MEQSAGQTSGTGLLPLADVSSMEIGQMATTDQRLFLNETALVIFALVLVVVLFIWHRIVHVRWRRQMAHLENACADLREKRDQVMQEVHHRVRGNLQTFSSLLNLQLRYLDDAKAKIAVSEGRDRFQSIGLLHKMLHEQETFTHIEFKPYVLALVKQLQSSHSVSPDMLSVEVEIDPVILHVEKAVPLGLLAHEMLSEQFRAARNEQPAKLILRVTEGSDGDLQIFIACPNRQTATDPETAGSYGRHLIRLLMKELHGVYENVTEREINIRF
ncbi:MAG: histidine kinase dimerization/phosphoacceptor domain -containing protein, partial [Bacteroidota bacterium]